MTARLFRVTALVLVVMQLAWLATILVLDAPTTDMEAEQLHRAFVGVRAQLADDASAFEALATEDTLTTLRTEDGVTVYWNAEDETYLITTRMEGTEVVLARPLLEWFPARTGLTIFLLGVALSLGVGTIVAVPLVRRTRTLERTVARFAAADYRERADESGNDEIASLAAHFNRMADRVEAHIETQRALMAAIAHEYRTPVARARLAAAMLEAPRDPEDAALQGRRLSAALSDLEALADEVRFFAQAERAVTGGEPVNFAELVKRGTASPHPADLPVAVETPEELLVQADARLLARVVDNLVRNARRHANDRVRLRLRRDGDMAVLEVEDDGPGIPADDRARVFEPFVRLDEARSRDEGGYGLGLAIVDRLARAHGGEVLVTDSELGGARFELRLPMTASSRPSGAAART